MIKNYLRDFVFLVFSVLVLESSLSADNEAQEKASYYNGKRATTEEIDIRGLDKKDLLLTLWDNAKAKNLSEEKFIGTVVLPTIFELRPTEKQINNALEDIALGKRIDYFVGRCLKVNLSEDVLKTFLYDRDHGTGAAQRAV